MIKKILHPTGKSLWFFLKIFIYLLVTWSIVFSIAVPWAAYRSYVYWQDFNQEIKDLQRGEVHSSFFIEKQKQSPRCNEGIQQEWLSIDSIPLALQKAVLAAEDASFYLHPGVNLEAILEALENNKRKGKKSFGGSTLTQQLAKNLFLSDERSFERKAKEMGYTLLMEKHLGKERILEMYLNIAQWGPCQFGCEAASQYFYGQSCNKLTLNQAVNLASILASPSKYNPENLNSKFLQARRSVIWNNLYGMRYLKRDTLEVDSSQAAGFENPKVGAKDLATEVKQDE